MPVDPEYELTQEERTALVAYGVQAFSVIKKIMEGEVAKFNVALLNCKVTEQNEILAAHTLAKAAAQFCVQVINRVNTEVYNFQHAQDATKEQVLEDTSVEDLTGDNIF